MVGKKYLHRKAKQIKLVASVLSKKSHWSSCTRRVVCEILVKHAGTNNKKVLTVGVTHDK